MLFIYCLYCGSNSVGRVTAFQAVGRGFESRLPLMNFSVYILKSELADVYYIGSTQDVQGRLKLHNSAKARWTKRHQPWILEYCEEFTTRSEAVRREKYFKSLKGIKRQLELLKATNFGES